MAKRKISLIGLVVVMICVLVFAPVVTAGIYFIHTVSGQLQHTASETVSMYLNEFTDRTDRMMETLRDGVYYLTSDSAAQQMMSSSEPLTQIQILQLEQNFSRAFSLGDSLNPDVVSAIYLIKNDQYVPVYGGNYYLNTSWRVRQMYQTHEDCNSARTLYTHYTIVGYAYMIDLLICLLDTAHVTTEAVLIQLLLGGLVPQAAGIRRDFVCKNDLAVRSLAELELKINEDDVQGIEVLLHNLVYLEGHCLDGLDLLTGSSFQCNRVVSVHERVAKLIVFVGELDGRLVEYDALFHAETLRKGTGGNVADDDLQRYNGDLLYQGLTLGELLNKVGRHALLLEQLEHVIAHYVVDNALAGDGTLLLTVECGCIVLVVNDYEICIVGSEYLLSLAFVQLFFLFHVQFLHLYK